MRETETDFKIGDDYQTAYESNYDDALQEFRSKIEPIKQRFEHLLNDDDVVSEVPFTTFKLFVNSVKKMEEFAYFSYYDDYAADYIEYDFIDELRDSLLDEYNWDIKEIN